MTVDDIVSRYVAKLQVGAKPAAIQTAEAALRQVQRRLGSREVMSLTKEDLRAYQKARLEKLSRPAVNKETRLLLHHAGALHTLIAVAAFTGLRNGELAALRWRDIDLDEEVLRVATRDDWSPKRASVALPGFVWVGRSLRSGLVKARSAQRCSSR